MTQNPLLPLRVSSNRQFLVREDGSPFFYLADNAWRIIPRLTRAELVEYFADRAAKGFTVVHVWLFFGDPRRPGLALHLSESGAAPLINDDPAQPNEAYFAEVDHAVSAAAAHRLYLAVMPCWGGYVVGAKPTRIFDEEKAAAYGSFLARRYANATNLLWLMGGNEHPFGKDGDFAAVWRAMARAIRGRGAQQLMSYMGHGGAQSSQWFHHDDWLDFNMSTTGIPQDFPNYEVIARDRALEPAKPTLDARGGFEGAHLAGDLERPRLDDFDMRKYAYWAVLAGACGHGYGSNELGQAYKPKFKPSNSPQVYWRHALHQPGAYHMGYLRRLIESRPMLTRVPDQELVASLHGAGNGRVQAARDETGAYAFVYITSGQMVRIRLERLSGSRLRGWWYSPRFGCAQPIGEMEKTGTKEFAPPFSGPGEDWVLVLDDAARGFPAPGPTPETAQGETVLFPLSR